jgi:hypothetical protein
MSSARMVEGGPLPPTKLPDERAQSERQDWIDAGAGHRPRILSASLSRARRNVFASSRFEEMRTSGAERRLGANVEGNFARGEARSPARAHRLRAALLSLCVVGWVAACDSPSTFVVLENRYPESTANPEVVYQGFWQAISFPSPLPPGASSSPQSTIAASANLAYVVLAPNWQVTSSAPPTSLIVLQSRTGFAVSLNQTLRIPVDDATFAGNCAAGSSLSSA